MSQGTPQPQRTAPVNPGTVLGGPLPAMMPRQGPALEKARAAVRHRFDGFCDHGGGLLVAVVDRRGARARFMKVARGEMRAGVAGRHDRCAFRIRDEGSSAGLRHTLLWATHTAHGVQTRAIDLNSQVPTRLAGVGAIESAGIAGPAGLLLGTAQVFIAPCAPGQQLAHALPSALPECQSVGTPIGAAARVPGPEIISPNGDGKSGLLMKVPQCRTMIERLEPPSHISGFEHESATVLPPQSASGLRLRYHRDGHPPRDAHLSWPQLNAGVLFGRYARCHRGGHELPEGVSRVHLGLFAQDGHVIALDLASTHGVSVDGVKRRHAQVQAGTRLSLIDEVCIEVLAVRQ